ncbi:MAG TPA: serpin family protein [Rhodothermales bacterium]|nr:serpin family protein [Rhodothermales bacterium]
MIRFTRLLFVVLFISYLAGCTDPVSTEDHPPEVNLSQAEQHLVEADNRFGLHLFRQLSQADAAENVFISPLSVSMALGMTMNGASGETRTAMEETLELAGLSEEEINASYRSLIDMLTTLDDKVTVGIANSIWHREGFAVEQGFLDMNHTFFDAEVQSLNFSRSEAADIINAWVDDKTHSKIQEIVNPPIPPEVVMYLINATYFKGDWRTQFDEDDTQDDVFRKADGTTVPVSMMNMAEMSFPMLQTERFQAIDLPYGDSLFSMTILLPNEPYNLDDIAQDLTAENWTAWTSQLAPQKLSLLQMPKFKLAYKKSLAETLGAMGMDIAFDEARADFSRINPNAHLFISEVKHKTFVEVDEEGTEAAAVTSVVVDVTSIRPMLRIDRPFLFAIREQATGTILFLGKMIDPSA